MTRKGSQVRVLPGAPLSCLTISGTDEPSDDISDPALVVNGRVQLEVANCDALLIDDPDIQVSHQDQDSFATMFTAYSHVVELRPVAKSEGSGLVDAVSADLGMSEQRLSVYFDGGLVESAPSAHRWT